MNNYFKNILSGLDKNLIVGLVYISNGLESCDWLQVSEIDIKNLNRNNIKIERIIIKEL